MSQAPPPHIANLALAIGVAAAMGMAVAIAVTHPLHRTASRGVAVGQNAALPARQSLASGFSAAALRPGAAADPFEPPPPIAEAGAVPASRVPASEQLAALTPPEAPAQPPAAASPLRTVDLDQHEIDAPPRHPAAPPRGMTATHEAPARAADVAAPDDSDDDDVGGVKLAGPAIVTGPLELNIDGKPLQLYGVMPPSGDDMCTPRRGFAARSCRDVSQEALAARIGPEGDVTCRILAVGGRSTLPAVCTDKTGADLATYLVQHGFALADSNEIVDYSGAETQAKSARSGLWSYR